MRLFEAFLFHQHLVTRMDHLKINDKTVPGKNLIQPDTAESSQKSPNSPFIAL